MGAAAASGARANRLGEASHPTVHPPESVLTLSLDAFPDQVRERWSPVGWGECPVEEQLVDHRADEKNEHDFDNQVNGSTRDLGCCGLHGFSQKPDQQHACRQGPSAHVGKSVRPPGVVR
jgi:hypothetical protein